MARGWPLITSGIAPLLERERTCRGRSATAEFGSSRTLAGSAADLEASELQTTAAAVDQNLLILTVQNSAEIETGFARLRTGIIVAAGSFEFRWMDMLLELAARYSLPAMYAGRKLVVAGGLISYSGSQTEVHRLAGIYCARILKGEKPEHLPVLLPNKLKLVLT